MSGPSDTVHELVNVEAQLPKSLGQHCLSCWTAMLDVFEECCTCFFWIFYVFCIFFTVLLILTFFFHWVIVLVVNNCQIGPGLGLDAVSIHNMTVYQNSTTSDGSTAWLVRSDINVNLTTWNENTVVGCYSTYRRMIASVYFKDQLLLNQDMPLGFKLKPSKKRPVVLELQGDGYVEKPNLASLLQAELRNASAVELSFNFRIRYLRNDHKSGWMGMTCDVITTTPLNSLGTTADLRHQSCKAA